MTVPPPPAGSPCPHPVPPASQPGRVRRRRVLGAIAAVPAVLAAGGAAAAGLRAVPLARPSARGSSTTRCARCGAAGHTMLDAVCPADPGVI